MKQRESTKTPQTRHIRDKSGYAVTLLIPPGERRS